MSTKKNAASPPTVTSSSSSSSSSSNLVPSELLNQLREIADSLGIQNEHHVPFLMASALLVTMVAARVVANNRALALFVPLGIAMRVTLPPLESFDAKKELKRVLRKDQLPDQHPDKPKGFFEKLATKAVASVTGELLTSAGYTLRTKTYFGVVHVCEVDLDATNTKCRWLGAFNKFYFVGQQATDE